MSLLERVPWSVGLVACLALLGACSDDATSAEAETEAPSETGDGDPGDGDGDPGDGDGDPGDGDGDLGDGDGDPGDGDGDPGDGDPGDGDGDPGDGDGDPGDGDGDPGGLTPADCIEDYSAEAWWIAVLDDGAAGPLQPSSESIEFANLHLCYLRLTNPSLTGVVQAEPWPADQMIVGLDPQAPDAEYQALLDQYGVTMEEPLFADTYVLHFAGSYNIPALANEFAALAAVEYAEPNGIIGGENDRYEPQDMGAGVWRWFVHDEFWDCFDGCDCAKVWSYDVDEAAGLVTEVSYTEQGQAWCEF